MSIASTDGEEMAKPKNKFTKEQIAVLKASPHVLSVNWNKVYYTAEFKQWFWGLYTIENMTPHEIIIDSGLNPEILGYARIRGLAQSLRKEYEKYGGFADSHGKKAVENQASQSKHKETDELKRLRAEVEYLRQEREFLKKIISAETEVKPK